MLLQRDLDSLDGQKYGCVFSSLINLIMVKTNTEFTIDEINDLARKSIEYGFMDEYFYINSYSDIISILGFKSDFEMIVDNPLSRLYKSENSLIFVKGHCELYLSDGKVFDPGYQGDTSVDIEGCLYKILNGNIVYSKYAEKRRMIKKVMIVNVYK